MKKVFALALTAFMLLGTAGFSNAGMTADSRTGHLEAEEETTAKYSFGSGPVHINLWSFTTEVPEMVKEYVNMNPDFGYKYTIDVTIVTTTDGNYQPILDYSLKNGEVDMYTAEAAFVKKYTRGTGAEFAASYRELGIDVNKAIKDSQIAQYTVDIGTRPSDNQVVALAYQACGGAMIYRASIAKEVFGGDDVATVEKAVGAGTNSYDTLWKAAGKLASYGYPLVSGDGDIWHMVENASSMPWVVDGELFIAPERQAFFDISKALYDNGWSNKTLDWTPGWYADIKGASQEGKNNKPAFCFFGPAWLINYVMVGNAGGETIGEGTYGDWRVCRSPVGFFWGGTWVLASKTAAQNADKKEGVAELIHWITLDASDKGLQYMWANGLLPGKYKDTVASGKVMATADGKLDFLGGQNMFEIYIPANENAEGKLLTEYDATINSLFREQVNQYVTGQKSIDEAIKDFQSQTSNKLHIDAASLPPKTNKPVPSQESVETVPSSAPATTVDSTRTTEETTARTRTRVKVDREQGNNFWMIIIIISSVSLAIIIGLVITIIVIVSSKKKKAKASVAAPQAPVQPIPAQQPVVPMQQQQATPAPQPAIPMPQQPAVPMPQQQQAIPAPQQQVVKKRFCPHCGAEQDPDENFCDKCGGKLR